jgi:hypothetical protein
VNEGRLFESMMIREVNPWVADSCGQLIARRGGCLICGNPEPPDPVYFEQGKTLTGLLQSTNKRTRLRMCMGCSETGEDITRITEVYQEENADIPGQLPLFELGTIDISRLRTNQALTSDGSAAFLSGGHPSLLRSEGGTFKIAPHTIEKFVLFVMHHAIILEIWIESDIDRFILKGPQGVKVMKREQEDGLFSFPLPEPAITQILHFSVETEDETVVIRKIQVLYIVTEFPFESVPIITNFPPIGWKKCQAVHSYVSADRTDTIKFTKTKIIRFMVEVVVEKNSRPPLSFVFVAFLDGKIVFRKHYVMPELDSGKTIWYRLDETLEVDLVKIFYLDRCPVMRPHNIKVSFDWGVQLTGLGGEVT